MFRLATLTAAAALVVAFGFAGTAKADFTFPFDGTDLVGYWHFDTNSGDADAVDGSVNSNDADLKNGATRSTDIPDIVSNLNSVELDGSDDTVEIGDDNALDVTGTLTLAAWVKRDATGGMEIVGKWDNSANQRSYELFFRGANDKIVIAISQNGSGNFMEAETTTVFDDTADWHHVAATYDPAGGGTMKVYFDGVLQAVTVTGSETSIFSGTGNVHIGTRNGTSNRMDGKIDDVRIYDVALTAAQVAQLNIAFSITVEKTLEDGPRVVVTGALTGLAGLTTDPFDAGPIDVGRSDRQFYEFKIKVTNEAGDDELNGTIIIDTIPAEYDLDKQCGEDPGDADICDSKGTGDVDRDADGNADGIVNLDVSECTVSTSTSGGGKKKGGKRLEPEFIKIVIDDLDAGGVCEIRVFVVTDGNPGHFVNNNGTPSDFSDDNFSLFEPTGCGKLDTTVFDTIALNEGFKVFDPVGGHRLFGPEGSLQLTPNNCP